MAMIIALGTSANVFAQQRNLKIYFNEYADGDTIPRMYVTDDHPNGEYDVPLGVTVSHEGVTWAGTSRFFEWITTDVTDRVMADYVKGSNGQVDKKNSHLMLTFTNFPYEVNVIQWNVMNDLLSGSLTNFFKNYGVTTKCTPVSDNGFSYTEEHWSLNIFTHSTTFNQGDIPWQSGATLNGLESFEISENYETKIGIGGWTWIDLGQSELNDKNRTFIKAGWNGDDTNPKVKDDDGNLINIEEDDNNWAFKVKFTLPDIRMRSYAYDKATGAIGQQDNLIYQGEKKVHALQGYISAHAGAVEPTYDPTDQSDFHFEYFADASQMSIQRYSGVILDAKVAGDIPVTVVLMRGRDREVCRYTQTISVSEKLELSQKAEICIGFVDGKKGYDLTLTEKNAQIKGFITNPAKDKNGQNVDLSITENASLCHFEYSESSEGEIITIDPLTGKITPKKEGDVQITAILKYGNNIYSDPFTYTLHVFGKYEGVDVNKRQGLNTPAELIYHYSTNATYTSWGTTYYSNPDNWKASELYSSSYASYDWKANTYLRPSTSILENSGSPSGAGQDGWKEIAWYKTSSAKYWRAIAQKICFDIRMPKYSTVDVNLSFAGNLNTGVSNGTNTMYGFEVLNLGNYKNTDVTKTNKAFNDITWNTTTTGENIKSASYTSLAQSAIINSGGYVGDGSNVHWAYDDITQSDFGNHRYYTHYLAVMAYIYRNGSYPSEFSVGYKGNLTYTYYTSITYYKNDGTSTVIRNKKDYTTTSKTETVKLFQNASTNEKNLLKRDGYTFLGWSTDPNATTAEYEFQDDFLLYDDVDGGGRGPVNLYAVWQPNEYKVELRKGPAAATGGTDYVRATYTQPMPEGEGVIAPTLTGYDFNGYYRASGTDTTYYYNKEMKSTHVWDRTAENDCYVQARWTVHKTKINLDSRGGVNNGASVVYATYGQAMPTEGLSAPQKTGYTFDGYYYEGNGGKYYNADMTSARTWYIDERTLDPQQTEITLYAKWIANTYTVELRKGPNSVVGGTDYVTATYNEPMPEGAEITAPTLTGYDFHGYYRATDTDTTYYYNKDMQSTHVWDRAESTYVQARWTVHRTKINLDPRGGVNYGASVVYATYNQPMPTEGLSAPQKTGYTFDGYYYEGNGGKYYNADMTSARKWYIDERTLDPQVTEITLYAKWTAIPYAVTLDPQGGTGGTTSVTATYGQVLPSGKIAPTKVGYEFKGYYSSQNQEYAEAMGQSYEGKQYYDKDMNGVLPWDLTYSATIYAHWKPKTYIVTFDLGDESHAAIFPDNVVSANKDRIMEITSDGKMKVSFDYGISGDNSIDLSVPKKPGYEMLGWYDANGDLIVTVDSKDRHAYITDKNNYWQKDGNNVKWNYADDLVLTAKFRCKYTVEDAGNGPIIKFDNEIVEPDQDWLSSVISDLQGAAKEVGTPENPVMAFDLRTSKNIWTGNKFARLNVMESLQSEEYKDYISPNVLVYFNDNESEAWYIDGTNPEYQGRNDADCYNAVSLDNKCRNLVVTDRYRIKIPYAFNASKASYARDAGIVDAETQQAQKSSWGTLCLPYSVKNNTSDVQYYWLRSMTNNYMEFEEFEDDAVIPANAPVLYRRTDGDVSSRINIVETNKNVPKNMAYQAVTIDYANVGNLVEGTYPLVSADATIHEWEFRGNLQTSVFCGKDYNKDKTLPAGAVQVDKGDVYYFKQNKFTHLLPRRVVNGVTYAAGKMTLYPYRAYFYLKDTGSSAKVSQYSILVMGEDGTLDITDLLFGDGEGDGKIYDLSGVRVMKPVKGRLYIVNGQKKVYR